MKYFAKGIHNKIRFLFLTALFLFLADSLSYAVTETIQYGYDNNRQITNVIYDDGTNVEYVYDNSGNRLFKTVTSGTPINSPPFAASDPSIPDGAIDVSTTPTLSWTGGDPDSGDDVVYFLHFGECGYESLVLSGTVTSYDPGQLNSMINYCWQVVSRDNHSEEIAGPVWNFTTANDAPSLPALVSPSDGSTAYATTANLQWSSSDSNPDDTVTYDIYFGTSNPPPLVQSGYPDSIYTVSSISKDTTYYWQIVAKDDHNTASSGPVWSFTGDFMIPTQIINGSLEVVSEYHIYPITLKAGDVIQARMGFTDEYPSAEPGMILYDTDGTTVICTNGSNAGTSAQFAYNGCQVSADGTYFIRVDDSIGDDLGGEYNLAVELLNNSNASMSYGDSVTGTLVAESDLTVHTFAASTNDMIAVTMGFTTAGPDPEMILYGPDGAEVSFLSCWVFQGNSTDNQTASIYECLLPADGIYTVLAMEWFGDETGGDYHLTIERLNNPVATMTYGETITDTLTVMQDLNIHTFEANSNDRVSVWMGFSTAGPDPSFRVYGPEGAFLSCTSTYPNSSTTQISAISHECDLTGGDGIYTVLVSEMNGNELGGDYNLTIERLNNTETTMVYGDTVNGTMTIRADLDSHTFGAVANAEVRVQLDFLTAGPDPQVRIYDPNGDYVCGIMTWDWLGPAVIDNCLLSQSGVYTIVVNDYGGDEIVGDYTLDLECTSVPANCNIPPAANAGGPYASVEGNVISLDGSGSTDADGTITLYEWDIDNDGTYDYSSASPSQNHSYAQNGAYNIKLRVTDNDNGNSTSVTTAAVADTSPTADFFGTPTEGPAPLTVNFSDMSSGYDQPLNFAWDFDNDAITDSNDQHPPYIYSSEGLYSVKLTVTDADGSPSSVTKTGYINVSGPLHTLTVAKTGTGTGTVTSTPAGIICGSDCDEQYSEGTTVTLTASADQGAQFIGWSGGGCSGTSTCDVTLNADISVTATFANKYYFYTTSSCGVQQYSQIPQYTVFGPVTGDCVSPDSVGKTFKGMKDLLIGYLDNGGYADDTLIEGQATGNLISLWVSGGDSTGYVYLVEVNPADGTVIQTLSSVSQPLYDGTYGYFTDLSTLSGSVSAGSTFGIMISADSPSRYLHEIKYGMTDGGASDAEQYISVMETSQTITCADGDSDGYGFPGGDSTCQNGPAEDCNDSDPDINPGATEGPEGDATCNDGADNDCDGLTDINDNDCVCVPTGLPDDTCDGVDDDCNGTPDDGYIPSPTTCGLGVCESTGQLECQSGTEVDTCTESTPTESPEVSCSDGLDNDCDGETDGTDPDCQGGGCNSNGTCDLGEDCQTCSNDCAGQLGGKPSNRFCCGDGIQQGPEGDGTICDGNY